MNFFHGNFPLSYTFDLVKVFGDNNDVKLAGSLFICQGWILSSPISKSLGIKTVLLQQVHTC